MDRKSAKLRRMAPLDTPTDLKTDGVREISARSMPFSLMYLRST